ncbi:MAG: hypothetical protein ACKVU1_13370 [bacterium]
MQAEINADTMNVAIQILGVNGIGQESGNAQTCANRILPWLQDTTPQNVWNKWAIVYRDVVIVDAINRPVAVFNLTTKNLAEPANYDSLMTLLLGAATR